MFDLVIQNPPLTRWGVVFGPSPPTEEEEKKENEEAGKKELGGGRQGGRGGGREGADVEGGVTRVGRIERRAALVSANQRQATFGTRLRPTLRREGRREEGGREGGRGREGRRDMRMRSERWGNAQPDVDTASCKTHIQVYICL